MSDFIRSNRFRPCQICGKTNSKCSTSRDGLLFCLNNHDAVVPGFTYRGPARDGTWGMYSADDVEYEPRLKPARTTATARPSTHISRPPECKQTYAEWQAQHGDELVPLDLWSAKLQQQLGSELGLPAAVVPDVLWRMDVHYLRNDGFNKDCWVFPWCDGRGEPIGASLRYRNKAKRTAVTLGVLIPELSQLPLASPYFIPEGASDVAALLAMRLRCLGRPNNTIGAEAVAEYVGANVPRDRRDLVFLAERDQNPNGTWPGLEGARATATKVAALLGINVRVALPPDGKDIREWFQAQIAAGQTPAQARAALLDWIYRTAEIITPPAQPTSPVPASGHDGCSHPTVSQPAPAALDLADLDQVAEVVTASRAAGRLPDLHEEEAKAAAKHRRAVNAIPPCHKRVLVKNRETNKGRLLFTPCNRWACMSCHPLLQAEWKGHLSQVLARHGGPFYAVNCTDEERARLYRRIYAQHGLYVCLLDGGCWLIVSTVALPGALRLTAREAVAHVCECIDRFPYCRKPIFTSRVWAIKREKTGLWERIGAIPSGISLERLFKVLDEAGVDYVFRPTVGKGKPRWSIEMIFPEGWTRADVEKLYCSLYHGDWLPDIDVDEFRPPVSQAVDDLQLCDVSGCWTDIS